MSQLADSWSLYLSCLYRLPIRTVSLSEGRPVKIAAFDLHGTLIQSKYARHLSTGADDWIWTGSLVPEYLNQLHKLKWIVVVYSNHRGFSNLPIVKQRMENLLQQLEFDPFIYIGISSAPEGKRPETRYFTDDLSLNPMIKPNLGMFHLFEQHFLGTNNDKYVEEAFYCGDAGRGSTPPNFLYQRSDTDYQFSQNIIAYHHQKYPSDLRFQPDNPRKLWRFFTPDQILPLQIKLTYPATQELIIMVGQPGSGKSTIARSILGLDVVEPRYVIISKDKLTKAKYLQLLRQTLQSGRSVIFDATNPSKEDRRLVIEIAENLNIPVRILWSARTGHYLNELRTGSDKVPSIALNTYSSRFEVPTPTEGRRLEVIQVS